MSLKKFIAQAPEEIKRFFVHKHYGKDEIINFPEQKIENLYIPVKGTVKVFRHNYSGSLENVYIIESYSCVGDIELFDENAKSLGIKAKTDCELLVIPKKMVFEWMKLDFEFNFFLIQQLSRRLAETTAALERIYFFGIKDRILISMYEHYKKNDLETLSKNNLSVEVCTPIRSLNRSLSKCIDEGFIEYKNKKFIIKSIEKLKEHVKQFI